MIFGLPFVRASNSKRNIVWHGYSKVIALILHTILILVVMVPSFTGGLGNISNLSVLEAFNVWSHVILGVTAEALGIIMIVVWLSKPRAVIACAKTRKWMIPTFIIWITSLINGTLIHILGLL